MSQYIDMELTVTRTRRSIETAHHREIRELKAAQRAHIITMKQEHQLEVKKLRADIKHAKEVARTFSDLYHHSQEWKNLRAEVLALDFYECTACDAPALLASYLTKPSAGGIPHIANLTASCSACSLAGRRENFTSIEQRRQFIQAARNND